MIRRQPPARDTGPGPFISLLLLTSLAFGVLLSACGSREPATPAARRMWEGPGEYVASSGVITYERREIAQKIPLPQCVSVLEDSYRFARVTPFPAGGTAPPGLMDTFFRLDRWRLWSQPGQLAGQPMVFVTVRGSTGIVAEYERVAPNEGCEP